MFWTDAWKLGSSMWANSFALQETALAAHHVIGHRSRTIDAAIRNPPAADIGELNRMVAEKLSAFGQAGSAWTEDWLDMQADLLAQGRDMMLLCTSWPPSSAVIERIGRRGAKLSVKMSTAGGRALKPVHATATANQRRLAGKSRPSTAGKRSAT